jgi:hypothetical protein
MWTINAQSQFFISSGEIVKVTAADELHVLEHLENNSTVDFLTLSGGNAQMISGTGSIWHLKVDKTTGTTASITGGMQSIYGTLNPLSGTLAAGGYLTLKSLSTGTARVAAHTTTGAVTGTVKVERYININGKNKQWRMLGFPYSTNLQISSITGMGMEFSASTKTMMYYVEGNDDGRYGNAGARNAGYQTFSSTADNIQPLTGVMAWLFGPTGTTASASGTMSDSMTILSSGTLNEAGADVSIPLSYTLSKGWNLVANPFASNLNWSGITKSNVEASLYRWNPHAADWTAHNGSTGTGAATDAIIEIGTAFFVRTTAASPSLTIPQTAKTSGATGFTHLSKAPFRLDIPGQRVPSGLPLSGIRIFSSGTGNQEPGDVYLDVSRPDASSGFDIQYDAWSMGRSSGADVAFIAAEDRLLEMQFDRPISEAGREKRYYPLRVTGISSGSASLALRAEGNWNPLNSISLIDHKEGKTLLMRGNELRYDFQLESLKTDGRFTLAINHVTLDADGQSPVFDVKLLGNPVTGDRLQLLVTHPSANARQWRIISTDGQLLGRGNFQQDAGIQHGITVPAMRNAGSYLLQVEMDNGELKSVPFLRK